jgi:hypothetical protein
MNILLAITFVYGIIHLLTQTKLFKDNTNYQYFIGTLFLTKTWNKPKPLISIMLLALFDILDIWFFYFSLIFQAWYWLFNK